MVDDVSGKATIQLYVKYNTTTLYRSNCEYNQSLKSFVTISLIFQSLLNILLIESHILIPLFFVIMMNENGCLLFVPCGCTLSRLKEESSH